MKPSISSGVTDLEIKSDAPEPQKPVRHKEWGRAAAGLMFGLAGLVAGRLGQLWPAFDVFSQFSAQFLLLIAAFTFAALMPRFKAFIGSVIFVILLLGYGLWPHLVSRQLPHGPYDLATGERAFRFAHFNSYFNNRDYAAQAAEIRRLDADVVSLVEFDQGKQPMLFALKSQYPFMYDCRGVSGCEMAILSKQPILAVAPKIFWDGPPLLSVKLGGTLAGVTVYSVHTTRFPHSRAQLKQAMALVGRLENETGPVVVMGDFNATPYSRVITTIEKGAGLQRFTQLPTWPSRFGLPQLAIDHVFATPGIRQLSPQQIGENAGSDHYPVVVTLGITR